jgi:hypothetical protein
MAPELSRRIRQVTFALLVFASTATEIAAVDTRPVLASLGLATVWVGLAAVLGWVVPVPKRGQSPFSESRVPPRFVLFLMLVLVAAPFVVEPFRRRWTGDGYPLELQMVFALRNLGLGLAACAAWTLCLRLAGVVSLFLMLFAISMTDHPGVLTLLGLYSAAGSVWLMLTYWTSLRRYFADSEAAALVVHTGRERLPWLAILLVVGLVSSVLGLVTVGPQRVGRVLGEWLPTSGGTDGYDPFARGGVNDGDDQVKGNNARSTGTIETDQFLDSPLPSLYDVANDLYGEPFKKREAQERAIPLDAQTKIRDTEKPPGDNQRPNREFATARKGPHQPRDPSDRTARALFEVQGRTPLHVRVAAYDVFDGMSWQEAPLNLNTCLLDKERDSCWMRVQERRPGPIFAENEGHQLKITSTFGSLVPTPPHTFRFRVGRVDQASFFVWGQDRILRMAQRKTPSGIIVETQSHTIDPRMLTDVEFPSGWTNARLDYTSVPKLHSEVSALAHRWADGHPRGWMQIAAVIGQLRREYVHDLSAHTPEGCDDPLAHFLTEARRGPDYQFASAAAVLLRVLGYATRLVCGFYVSPEHYDPATRHTPVVEEDLHFWAEVMLPWGEWLVVEPTPGYEVLGPSLPWSERLWTTLLAVAFWAWQHAVELSLSLLTAGASWWWRREVFDAAGVTFWRWFPGKSWRQCVRRALWLLEWRGRWAGQPRRPCQTTRDWLYASLPEPRAGDVEIEALTRMAEWASYASDLAPPWKRAEIRSVCCRVVNNWTLQQWRKARVARAVCGA